MDTGLSLFLIRLLASIRNKIPSTKVQIPSYVDSAKSGENRPNMYHATYSTPIIFFYK